MPRVLGIKDGSYKSDVQTQRVRGNRWKDTKRFSQTYIVLADDDTQTDSDIQNTTGIPPKFYPLYGCYCVAHHPVEVATIKHPVTGVTTILWEVTVDFDSDVDPDEDDLPESRPPKTRWIGEVEEEVLERDTVTGAAIQTANYERILVTTPAVLPVLEITRWEFYPFNPLVMLFYANRVNRTWFWGAPPGTALMLPMEVGEYELMNGIKYVPVTYRIKFKLRPDPSNPAILLQNPWKARVLHQGYAVRPAAGVTPEIHVDANERPTMVNLNLDGTENTSATPVYLEWNRFALADLNALSLGPFA